MVQRRFWLGALEKAWKRRTLIWLMGARRTGKTVLTHEIPNSRYLDCELPSVRRLLEDSESFLSEMRGGTVILDEVHRLPNPAEILKIAADHFADVRILATGSSSLAASAKFRDTLTGRKEEILLTPMNHSDYSDFGGKSLRRRLHHGGMPEFFLAAEFPERGYQEWLESYWARDIQELFRLERRYSFLRFVELLMAQSGGIFEAAAFARPCEVSRPTIQNYLTALEATFIAAIVRPYHTHRATEIVAAPKVYGFDTGFVCAFRGWTQLRADDLGLLWEHYVLNEIRSHWPHLRVNYWRDKQKHEIDFVIPRGSDAAPAAIECKWSAGAFDPGNLRIFRNRYPGGENYAVTEDTTDAYSRSFGSLTVRFVGMPGLVEALKSAAGRGDA